MHQAILKPGRDKPVRQRHPWIFSGAIAQFKGDLADGEPIDVRSASGEWLARGILNRRSQIAIRLLTWDEREPIDERLWQTRLDRARAGRERLPWIGDATAYRLVNAESDGLPGLVVDRYGDWWVTQFLTLGADRWKDTVARWLMAAPGVRGVYDRSDVDVRGKEGLPPSSGVLSGEEPPDLVETIENGLHFLVDIRRGHKTGFYLDQRDNRRRTAPYLAGRRVLNCFSFSGAFGLYARTAGAERVTQVDSSADALELARRNAALNFPQDEAAFEYVTGDVFAELRRFRAEERSFGAVVLDPPKFAQNDRQIQRAARGYQDINRVAMNILEPGGILVTFSCSGLVTPDLFQKIVFSASVEAGRTVQIVEKLGQSNDHPILLTLPESEYLKGFVCRVI